MNFAIKPNRQEVEVKRTKYTGPHRCSWHKPDNLDFLSASADAEERLANGELQRQCPVCHLWHWRHEWGNEPKGLNLPMVLAQEGETHIEKEE